MQSSFFLFCFAALAATLDAALTAILYYLADTIVKHSGFGSEFAPIKTLKEFCENTTVPVVAIGGIGQAFTLYLFLEAFVWYTN